MACKTNKIPRLYLYIVLAVVVLLTLFSNSRKTMVRIIVAGSSASQHPLQEARVKRLLRPNSNMTEEIHGGDEERVGLDLNAPLIENVGLDLNAPLIENVIGAMNTADELEAKLDKNMEGLLESVSFQDWARYMDLAYQGHHVKAAIAKISKLITRYGKEQVNAMLAAGKNVDTTRPVVEHLELGLALKWTSDGNMGRAVALLAAGENDVTKFLGTQSLKDYIDYCAETMNENPYSLLFTEYFSQRFDDRELAEKLVVAKGNGGAKNVATELEKQLIENWLEKNGKSGKAVFDRLELKQEGIDRPEWDTWVLYLVKRYAGDEIEEKEEENELVLSVLREIFADDDAELKKWLAAAESDKGKERATALLEKLVGRDGKAPTTLKTVEELVADTAMFENTEGLLDSAVFKKWVKNMIKTKRNPVGARIAMISALITRYGETKVRSMLAAGKNVPATRSTAERLELGLALKWTKDGRMNDVDTLLAVGNNDVIKIMGSQLMKDWTYYCENWLKKDPYSLLLKEFFSKKDNDEFLLAKVLAVAKDNAAAKNVATKLEEHLIKKWAHEGMSGDTVFKDLGLEDAGIDMLDRSVWDTWVSYMLELHVAENIGEEDKYTLVLSELNVADDVLHESLYAAKTPKGMDRAIALAAARQREESAHTREEPRKRPGANDGEASKTTKRQRNADGQ